MDLSSCISVISMLSVNPHWFNGLVSASDTVAQIVLICVLIKTLNVCLQGYAFVLLDLVSIVI